MKYWQTTLMILLSITLLILSTACDSSNENVQTDGDTETDAEIQLDGDADDDLETELDSDFETDTDSEVELEAEEQEPVCIAPVQIRELDNNPDMTFDFGPYLMQPQQNSIIVMWHTLESYDGTVLYGVGDELDQSVSQDGASTIHEIKLENLEPDTRYSYKVRSAHKTSDVHHFHTAPGAEQGFNIVMWGDSQDNPHIFAKLVDHMVTMNPHFALGMGDHVSEGGEWPQWKERLFDPARAMLHEVGFYAAIGNHARNHQNWYDLMSFPHPEDNPQHESFYSFTYGNAFFLVIDTDKPYFSIAGIDTEISAFINEQVKSPEAQAATWRFAVSHVPGYAEAWGDAECESYGGDLAIREWLYDLLNENKFHAHFSGHMHGYERGQSGNLMTIINGGGGGGLDSWCVDLPQVSVVNYEHHHLYMEVGCDTVKISAYHMDGQKFDWLEINADDYGTIVDEGPIDDLPDPPVDPNSPTLIED